MVTLGDFSTSVERALREVSRGYDTYPGLVICGTHSPNLGDAWLQMEKIKEARETGLPFLGVCWGHQLAAVEYARNVLNKPEAATEELNDGSEHIVVKLPQLKVGLYEGESYWNNYEVLPEFLEVWKKPDNFITVQYHPEYQSSKDKPHKDLVKFIQLCKEYSAE